MAAGGLKLRSLNLLSLLAGSAQHAVALQRRLRTLNVRAQRLCYVALVAHSLPVPQRGIARLSTAITTSNTGLVTAQDLSPHPLNHPHSFCPRRCPGQPDPLARISNPSPAARYQPVLRFASIASDFQPHAYTLLCPSPISSSMKIQAGYHGTLNLIPFLHSGNSHNHVPHYQTSTNTTTTRGRPFYTRLRTCPTRYCCRSPCPTPFRCPSSASSLPSRPSGSPRPRPPTRP